MYNNDLVVSKVLKNAELKARELKHQYVGIEHLLLSLMELDKDISTYLAKYKVYYSNFYNELKLVTNKYNVNDSFLLYTPVLKRILSKIDNNINTFNLLKLIIESDSNLVIKILINMNVDVDSLYDDLKRCKRASVPEELFKIGINLNECVKDDLLVGRDDELKQIIQILLRKNKNNPLLVGPAGVGKTALVEELARRISKGEVPEELKDKIIVSVAMSSLVAGTKYRGEFEEKLETIIKELEASQNIILFIDEVHTMSNAGGAEGAINASDILKPYLARGTIKVIGATTTEEYNKYIAKDKALSRRFEVVNIDEPTEEETINILTKLIPIYESFYNIKVTKKIIKEIVTLTNKYILNQYNPDKSIDLLDSICASIKVDNKKLVKYNKLNNKLKELSFQKLQMVSSNNFYKATYLREEELRISKYLNNLKENRKSITSKVIKEVLYKRCNIKSYSNTTFINLSKYLKSKISGEDINIDKICNTLKCGDKKTFLLAGPSNNKSYTIELISKYLDLPIININTCEFRDQSSLNRLLGTCAGFVGYDEEAIFDKLKNNPSSIVVFDNLSIDNDILKELINTILTKGYITNNKNEMINFLSTYIFITTDDKLNKAIGFISNNKNNNNELISNIECIVNYNDNTLKI